MPRKLLLATAIAAVVCGVTANRVYGMAGDLRTPGIAIPATDGTPDPTVTAMNRVLVAHEKQFVGGHYINAHSVLRFAGGTKTINALLDELSKIEGATLHITFGGRAGLVEALPGAGQESTRPYDCVIDHNAWADPGCLSIAIYVGDRVKLED